MPLRIANVGRAPVDLAAQLMLDGSRITIENLGDRPIRFVPAAAAGEAAPEDLRAGWLLKPGERETFQPLSAAGAAFPLWAWGGGVVGVGPAIGPGSAGGIGGGGGLALLVSGQSVETKLDGDHNAGDTVLSVDDATGLAAGRVYVRGEQHTIESVDEAADTITITAPGLTADQADDAVVVQAPMQGADDTLALPAGSYAELAVRCLYELPQTNGNPAAYSGRSIGAYYTSAGKRSGWTDTLTGFGSWYSYMDSNTDAATVLVGLVHDNHTLRTAWSIEFNPTTSQLSFALVPSNSARPYFPRLTSLLVAGR